MTPERFARGMTFDEYLRFTGSPENLAREGFDTRRFSLVRPARVAVLSEDWSSDCRRDVPYLARLAEAGGLELRIFTRDGETMLRKGLPDPAAGDNADLVVARAGETEAQTKARAGQDSATLLESPFFDVWAQAGIAEILSALHERLLLR